MSKDKLDVAKQYLARKTKLERLQSEVEMLNVELGKAEDDLEESSKKLSEVTNDLETYFDIGGKTYRSKRQGDRVRLLPIQINKE